MTRITEEAEPVHPLVADALRFAAEQLEAEGDDRARLLREMTTGFVCKAGSGNLWRLRVKKFHTGRVKYYCEDLIERASKDACVALAEFLREGKRPYVYCSGISARLATDVYHVNVNADVSFEITPEQKAIRDDLTHENLIRVSVEAFDRQVERTLRETLDFPCQWVALPQPPVHYEAYRAQELRPEVAYHSVHFRRELILPAGPIKRHLGFGDDESQ